LFGLIISRRLLRPVEESYAAQERFIQDAAHELRNPLAAMSATLETAKISKDKTLTIDRLERQTKRLIQINEDLLFLQRSPEPDNIKQQDISYLANKIISELSLSAKEKKIKINAEVQNNLKIKILPRDFELVLRNLIDNALKYSDSGTFISVKVRKHDRRIKIQVTDQGIGIPINEISSVTQRFYRAKNSSTIQGSGLGLALVQKVVDAYGGSIRITSKSGTTITIIL